MPATATAHTHTHTQLLWGNLTTRELLNAHHRIACAYNAPCRAPNKSLFDRSRSLPGISPAGRAILCKRSPRPGAVTATVARRRTLNLNLGTRGFKGRGKGSSHWDVTVTAPKRATEQQSTGAHREKSPPHARALRQLKCNRGEPRWDLVPAPLSCSRAHVVVSLAYSHCGGHRIKAGMQSRFRSSRSFLVGSCGFAQGTVFASQCRLWGREVRSGGGGKFASH